MALGEFTLELLVIAFAGGLFGAALGALRALGLAGIAIVVGEFRQLVVTGEASNAFPGLEVAAAPVEATGVTAIVGLGPFLGPHVAFAGGVAAAAFVGRKQTIDTAFRYHQAKQIARPLPRTPSVLLVGGVFGVLGVVLARLIAEIGVPVDPIALVVVLSAFSHRLAFGYHLVGRIRGLDRSILNMSPFEEGDYWGDEGNETAQGTGGRHVVEPWLPGYTDWKSLVLIGGGVGIGAALLAILTGSVFLAFGITLASLLALSLGVYDLPVTHHVALPASIVALAVGTDPLVGLLGGVIFGIGGAVLGELAGRVFYAHGDTHLDPAFVSILLTSLALTVLAATGMIDPGPVPYPVP